MIEAFTFEDVAEDYPRVFKAGRPRCGFGVGKGWEVLVRELCQGIEDLLPEESDFSVQQVKEKFGGLRFYLSGAPSWYHLTVRGAESSSYQTCETCGKYGSPKTPDGNPYGWWKTVCDDCHPDANYKKPEKE